MLHYALESSLSFMFSAIRIKIKLAVLTIAKFCGLQNQLSVESTVLFLFRNEKDT